MSSFGAAAAGAPQLKPQIEAAQAIAIAALEEYGRWLEKDLLPRSDGNFRLGEAKVSAVSSPWHWNPICRRKKSCGEPRRISNARSARCTKSRYRYSRATFRRRTTARAWPTKNSSSSRCSTDWRQTGRRTTRSWRLPATLERTTLFVREHNLVTVPDEPVKTIVMPEFDRGVAVAYCRSAPPLDPKGQTFYAIAPRRETDRGARRVLLPRVQQLHDGGPHDP